MSMAGVTYDKATRIYPGTEKPAVDALDLEIGDGEFLVVVGPSGCGKSTALRMLAGLEDIDSGAIRIGGRDVTHLPPKDRDIAMVFQNYALYPHMSVFENMAYGLKIRGLPKAEIAARVQQAADLLGLGALLQRRPRQLSGGQRQRVAMGRAIVREPKLFLFDEPLSNLDAKLRVQMRAEIKRLQRRLGVTSLYVTHDQVEAMTLGDRLVVMHEGRAEQVATPMEVWSRPANTFVAGFIGAPAMNFLEATLAPGGEAAVLKAGPRLAFIDGRRPLPDGTALTIGIRPEHVVAGGEGAVGLRVDLVEPLGAESLVHGQLPSGEEMTVRLSGSSPLPGAILPVTLPPLTLHVFEAATGRRVDGVLHPMRADSAASVANVGVDR
jgi:sn-glycerol 3-phosphate transport system ATP-binding protein